MPAPVIDFHVHFSDPELHRRGDAHNVMSGFGTRPMRQAKPGDGWHYDIQQKVGNPAQQVADMDKFGIGKHVISLIGVSCNTDWAEPEEAAALNRHANEMNAEWVRKYPDRFVGSFTLPLHDMKLAMKELDYAVDTLGATVASVSSNSRGDYLGEEKFRPFWEAVHAKNLAVFIHPHGSPDMRLQKYFLWNGIGQPIEETRVMASLIFEGVLDRFPGVKIVMAHGGGYLPHYAGRLDRNIENNPAIGVNLSKKPSEYLRDFYYDTCVYGADVLEALVKRVGIDRIVFGTDYPVGERDPFATLKACKALSEQDREMITRQTPAKILGLA
ncbi:MAG TPA: amidohydrolase family protein [Stellaceae bacterium]|jgi:aminocarboxymuconate-semialdehyde decarboxylase|nr:amidohydrolase family protein [Stellaceae bacterium]